MARVNRFKHVSLDVTSFEQREIAEAHFNGVCDLLSKMPPSRAQAIAFTELEKCFMAIETAIKHAQLTREIRSALGHLEAADQLSSDKD